MTLRWLTAGESHGPALVGIIAGIPAGLEVWPGRVDAELLRRQQGVGRSERQSIERDMARFLAGIRHGRTIGSPIAILVENIDHQNWREEMSPEPVESPGREARRAFPRPGHAGLAGILKWGLDDARNVLERASGRTTAVTVALGAICKQYLEHFDIFIGSRIIAFGPMRLVENDDPPTRIDIGDNAASLPNWCILSDEQLSMMKDLVESARTSGDTLGGVVQVVAAHVPAGLGSCALPDERLDSRLAAAALGVPGVKAVEIGAGIRQAGMGGKEAHDQYAIAEPAAQAPWYARSTNLAGGIEGGITNGEPVCVRAWMKPLSTVRPPSVSIDPVTRSPVMPETSERSDVAAVESVACVMEAVVALELARAHREKFGGDTMEEAGAAAERYAGSIKDGSD